MATPKRLPWIFSAYPVFYLTACAYDRRRIMAQPVVQTAFATCAVNFSHRGIWIGRYVLMPDHIHFFAAFRPNSISLSTMMKSLKNEISKSMLSANIVAPHWEKGFFDRVMRSRESYEQKWLYVRENPVRAGLVEKAEDWVFSGEIFEVVQGE